jgi:hypothetical protein
MGGERIQATLQVIPNAFELFGVDFLISWNQLEKQPFAVKLLEFNSEPAIEQTGKRLHWILEDLFAGICEAFVLPRVGAVKENLRCSELFTKCCSMEIPR